MSVAVCVEGLLSAIERNACCDIFVGFLANNELGANENSIRFYV